MHLTSCKGVIQGGNISIKDADDEGFFRLYFIQLTTADGALQSHPSQQKEDDETNEFRNKLQIRVKGNDIPKPCATFSSMSISKVIKNDILQNIEKSSWKEPTPIQMQAIPALLQGRDLLATAPTGSGRYRIICYELESAFVKHVRITGKTGAFVIPILSKLGDLSCTTNRQPRLKVLVIAPTKELADQIHREMERLAAGKRMQICLLKKNLMATAIASQVTVCPLLIVLSLIFVLFLYYYSYNY